MEAGQWRHAFGRQGTKERATFEPVRSDVASGIRLAGDGDAAADVAAAGGGSPSGGKFRCDPFLGPSRPSACRPATIQFDPTTGRAAGFAGCNRYSAGYTLAGDSLTFGPAVSTKMACAGGDELERAYLAMLPAIRSYALSDSTLTLNGSGGPLARFRAP